MRHLDDYRRGKAFGEQIQDIILALTGISACRNASFSVKTVSTGSAWTAQKGDGLMFKKSYMFTNRNHPLKGIMATILGILSIVTLITTVYLSYRQGGVSSLRYGTAALLAVLFMITGIGLSAYCLVERDNFKFFPVLGLLLNSVAAVILSLILYAGAYVN